MRLTDPSLFRWSKSLDFFASYGDRHSHVLSSLDPTWEHAQIVHTHDDGRLPHSHLLMVGPETADLGSDEAVTDLRPPLRVV